MPNKKYLPINNDCTYFNPILMVCEIIGGPCNFPADPSQCPDYPKIERSAAKPRQKKQEVVKPVVPTLMQLIPPIRPDPTMINTETVSEWLLRAQAELAMMGIVTFIEGIDEQEIEPPTKEIILEDF